MSTTSLQRWLGPGVAVLRAMLTSIVIFLVFGAVGVLLWIGGHDVLSGRITAGELSSFVFYAIVAFFAPTAAARAFRFRCWATGTTATTSSAPVSATSVLKTRPGTSPSASAASSP